MVKFEEQNRTFNTGAGVYTRRAQGQPSIAAAIGVGAEKPRGAADGRAGWWRENHRRQRPRRAPPHTKSRAVCTPHCHPPAGAAPRQARGAIAAAIGVGAQKPRDAVHGRTGWRREHRRRRGPGARAVRPQPGERAPCCAAQQHYTHRKSRRADSSPPRAQTAAQKAGGGTGATTGSEVAHTAPAAPRGSAATPPPQV